MHLIKYIDGTYNSFLAKMFLFPLYIISLIYGLIIRIRFFFYTTGTFKTRQLPYPVISVGNITVGGSGKTPMTIYLARRLTEKGKKVTVISRGYKGKNKGVGIVSDGQNIFMNPEEAGDEPFLIASKVKDCPVIIGKDRYKAGLLAVKRFKPDLIILDDGFQHIKLKRDKNIVLIDSIRGFGNGHLLPRGILREPASSLKRATHILISGDDGKEIVDKIALSNINSIRSFRYVPTGIVNLTNNTKFPIDCLKNKKVLAFSGIANPVSFFITLKNTGAIIKNTFVFKDHHRYTIKNLDNIKRDSCGTAYIITTEKDSVKIKDILPSDMDVYAMTIDIVIDNEQEFLTQIC